MHWLNNLIGLLVYLGVVALFAAGLVLAIRIMAPGMERKRRLAIASLVAASLPTLIPIAVVLITNSGDSEVWIVVIALVIMAIFLSVVAGLPAALLADRRLAKSGKPDEVPPQ